ncbi:MAG: AAA family ATPase, partial [Gammaproteobacteria bacterium]|nr:AAA family ATPase [Gammaproteobacteria bacterium]
MYKRHISRQVLEAAARNPVVTLLGPRQSGKTTLCRALFPDHNYLTLEAPDVRSRALDDPRELLKSTAPMIIDEVQRAPDLLSYIQVSVDEDPRPGRFVLTGSQNLLL